MLAILRLKNVLGLPKAFFLLKIWEAANFFLYFNRIALMKKKKKFLATCQQIFINS